MRKQQDGNQGKRECQRERGQQCQTCRTVQGNKGKKWPLDLVTGKLFVIDPTGYNEESYK